MSVPVPGCRSLCEHVRSDCGGVLWPPALDCAVLPLPETGLCMQHPDITQLPPVLPHNTSLATGDPDLGSLHLTSLLSSLALMLLSVLCLVCLLQQGDKEELRMLVISQLVQATGLLVGGMAGREDSSSTGERRVVCNLLAMLAYTGHLASLAWWTVAASSLLGSARQLSAQGVQTLVWGAVSLACIATFTGKGVGVEPVTGLCHMEERFMSTQIPTAIFLVLSLLLLVAGLFSNKQEKCRQTMLVSYLYFFIFLGVFITDIWPDIHGPSEPGLALFLGYFKLSLQFLQIGLSSLIVISSYLVTFFRSKDKTFSSESEISNLRNSSSEAKGSGHNIISTRTLISNIST